MKNKYDNSYAERVTYLWDKYSEVNGGTVFYTKHAQEATACSYDFLIKESSGFRKKKKKYL